MIDLNNDWLRRDIAGTASTYYGYSSDIAASDTDRIWSIRKISTVGTVDSVKWSDNQKFNFTGKWSERVACFTAPSGSLGITYSKTNIATNVVQINSSWSFLAGVSTYKVYMVDQNGILYNNLGNQFNNTYVSERITTITNDNRFIFNGVTGMTYSLTVSGVNVAGTQSATSTITT